MTRGYLTCAHFQFEDDFHTISRQAYVMSSRKLAKRINSTVVKPVTEFFLHSVTIKCRARIRLF